jgi:hypothetical protein
VITDRDFWLDMKEPGDDCYVLHADYGVGRVITVDDGSLYTQFVGDVAPLRMNRFSLRPWTFDLWNQGIEPPVIEPPKFWRPGSRNWITRLPKPHPSEAPFTEDHWRRYRASWDRCVELTREYYDRKGEGMLEKAHQAVFTKASQTWHIEMQNFPESHSANELREYYDEGMTVTQRRGVPGMSAHNVDDMLAAVTTLEVIKGDEMAQLCALRIRLACAGYDQKRAAEYLGISMYYLQFLEGFVGHIIEMHPPSNYYAVPLNRKRAPKAGWAHNIISRELKKIQSWPESLRNRLNPVP